MNSTNALTRCGSWELSSTIFRRPNSSQTLCTMTSATTAAATPQTQTSHGRLWLAELSLLSVAIIWGVNIPLMKTALGISVGGRTMHPYAFNAIRLVISAIVLCAFALREYRRGVRPSPTVSWLRVLIYAIVVSGAYQLLFLLAVTRSTSADISLIMATVPMWTALSARAFLKELLPGLAWIGLFIAFTGTMIVTLQKPVITPTVAASQLNNSELDASQRATLESKARDRLLGNVLSLVAALAWAGGTVFSRPLLKSISPTQLSACSATIGPSASRRRCPALCPRGIALTAAICGQRSS